MVIEYGRVYRWEVGLVTEGEPDLLLKVWFFPLGQPTNIYYKEEVIADYTEVEDTITEMLGSEGLLPG